MKRALFILAILFWIVGFGAAEELKTLSLDDPAAIGLKIQADTKAKVEGQASLKVTTPWPTSVCLGEVAGLNVQGATLVTTAQARSKLQGGAYLEIWVVIGKGRYYARGLDSQVSGTKGWTPIRTAFQLAKGQTPDRVILNLVINGSGTVWIDDVRLAREPLR